MAQSFCEWHHHLTGHVHTPSPAPEAPHRQRNGQATSSIPGQACRPGQRYSNNSVAIACCFPIWVLFVTQQSSSSIDLCTNEDLASVTVNCSLCCKSKATQACKSGRSRRAQRERRRCDGPSPRRVRHNRLRFQLWHPCRVECVFRPLAPVTVSQNMKNCLCFMVNSTSFTHHRNRGTRSSLLVGHVAKYRHQCEFTARCRVQGAQIPSNRDRRLPR